MLRWNYFSTISAVVWKSESEFNNASVMIGVFKPSFPVIESKDTGVFGTVQSAEAVSKSFKSYVLGERHDTI